MSEVPPNDPTRVQPPPGFAPPPPAGPSPSAPKPAGSGLGKLLGLAALALIVGLVGGFLVGQSSKQGDIDTLEEDLASTEDDLDEAEEEAEALQESNDDLNAQLETAQSDLDSANAEVESLSSLLEGAEAGVAACGSAIPQIVALLDLDDLNTQFVDRMIAAINNGEDVQQPPLVDELNALIDQIEALQASIDFDALVACEDAVA